MKHHETKENFKLFLNLARNPHLYKISVKNEENKKPKTYEIDGAILLWGKVNPNSKTEIKNEKGFYDILSLEDMINDLQSWNDQNYIDYVNKIQNWTNFLYNNLLN